MSQFNWYGLLWLVPLLVGAIIAGLNKDRVNDITESIEARFRGWKQRTAGRDGFLYRWVLNPLLWTIVKFFDWTDSFSHRGLKNGMRVAMTLYLIALWLLLLYSAIVIAIMIAMVLIGLFIVGKILSASSGGGSSSYSYSRAETINDDDSRNIVGPRGARVYAGSNWFTEELAGRVDDEGNIYSGSNWLTEEKIGRIDEDGNVYKGTSFLNEEKIGRIDEDGTLYKGSNWFTEEKTGRIDEDGTIFKGTNWFNEEKTGRAGK